MIAAHELMIGNWVLLEKDGAKAYYDVCGHDIDEIEGYGEDVFPIPLTPAILEAAGFEKYYDDFYYKVMGDILINQDGIIYFEAPDNIIHSIGSCLYVHQLQNLFFALTGQELEINLSKEK